MVQKLPLPCNNNNSCLINKIIWSTIMTSLFWTWSPLYVLCVYHLWSTTEISTTWKNFQLAFDTTLITWPRTTKSANLFDILRFPWDSVILVVLIKITVPTIHIWKEDQEEIKADLFDMKCVCVIYPPPVNDIIDNCDECCVVMILFLSLCLRINESCTDTTILQDTTKMK